MRTIVACLLCTFAVLGLSAQKTIDNKIVRISMDSSYTRSSFNCTHADNLDTALIENLSCWIYGKSNGQEYLSIQNAINYNDLKYGTSNDQFGKITAVSQPQITDHKYQFSSIDYNIPMGILDWPGSLNQEPLASYVDVNQNNTYDPQKGDYPYIRGDQCLVSVHHDNASRSTSLEALNVSLVQYHFIFANSGDPILDHTIGFRWVLKNNSNRTYDTALVGIQFHALLNKLNSNYIGTDVNHNAIFAYEANGNGKYASILLLNQKLKQTMYYKNTGQTNNKNDIPTNEQHFINYLQSRWKDGDSLKLGSTGLDGDSSVSFVFPNTTVPNHSAWTEDIVGNQGGDRNGVMVTQFTNWKPNEFKVLEGAILFQENINSLQALYQRHQMLENAYQNTQFSASKNLSANPKFNLYPNPVIGSNAIEFESDQVIKEVNVFDIYGAILFSKKLDNSKSQIKLNNLKSQTIFIQATFEDGNSLTKALIVQ